MHLDQIAIAQNGQVLFDRRPGDVELIRDLGACNAFM